MKLLWTLIKNNLRYLLKQIFSFLGLTILIIIGVVTFGSFSMLEHNISSNFNSLKKDYNLHDIVISEFYRSDASNEKKILFREYLASIAGLEVQEFKSINIKNSNDNLNLKLIESSPSQNIDRLKIYEGSNLSNPIDFSWVEKINVYHNKTYNNFYNLTEFLEISEKDSFIDLNLGLFKNKEFILELPDLTPYIKLAKYKIDSFIDQTNKQVGLVLSIVDDKQTKRFASKNLAFFPLESFNNPDNIQSKPLNLLPFYETENLEQLNLLLNRIKLIQDLNIKTIQSLDKIDVDFKIFNANYVINAPNQIDITQWLEFDYHQLTEVLAGVNPSIPSAGTILKKNAFYDDFGKAYVAYEIKSTNGNEKILLKNVSISTFVKNRQQLISLASKGSWSGGSSLVPGQNTNDMIRSVSFLDYYVKTHPYFDPGVLVLDKYSSSSIVKDFINQYFNASPHFKYEHYNALVTNLSKWINSSDEYYEPPIIKGFRITLSASIRSNNSFVGNISCKYETPVSFAAVVSPQYLKNHNKEVFDPKIWNQVSTSEIKYSDFLKWFNNISDKYKIYIDAIPYLIIGTGLSPDFIYPIISFESTVPNIQKELLVYTNANGYARAYDSYRNVENENLLVLDYNGTLPINSVLNMINKKASELMGYPSGTNAAYLYNDPNNLLSPTGLRINFILNLVTLIKTLSSIITIFILIICFTTITILIRRFIVLNKKQIGIAIANGVSKFKVILSLCVVGLIPCLLGGIIGYTIAYFSQPLGLYLVSSYWTIPTTFISYSPLLLFLAIIIPIILFIALVFLISIWTLRKGVKQLIDSNATINQSWVASKSHWLLFGKNIMFKFRSSILLNSFFKIITLSIISIIAVTSTSFVISTYDAFSKPFDVIQKSMKFDYAIDLYSPTAQGGYYYGINSNDLGKRVNNEYGSQNYIHSSYSNELQYMELFKEYANLHFPSSDDAVLKENELMYLNLKTQIKPLLDFDFSGTNPWLLSESLMPVNQINLANQYNIKFFEHAIVNNSIIPWSIFDKTFNNRNDGTFLKKDFYKITTNNTPLSVQKAFLKTYDIDFNNNVNPLIDKTIYIYNVFNKVSDWSNTIIGPNQIWIDGSKLNLTNIEQFQNDFNNPNKLMDQLNSLYADGFDKTISDYLFNSALNINPFDRYDYDPNANIIKLVLNDDAFAKNIINQFILTIRSILIGYFLKTFHTNSDSQTYYEDLYTKDKFIINNNYLVDITKLNPVYIATFLHIYNKNYYSNLNYKITYKSVALDYDPKSSNNKQEPYVYVDGTITSSIYSKYNPNKDVKINGILKNSNLVQLFDKNNNKINDLLFGDTPGSIIISEFMAKKFNLNVGSTITVYPKNHLNRFKIGFTVPKFDLTVVGISEIYNDEQIFTSIQTARNILGMEDIDFIEFNNQQKPIFINFNGVFAATFDPTILTSSIGLYSPSGLYPAFDSWSTNATASFNVITNAINKTGSEAYKQLENALSMPINSYKSINEILNELITVYGNDTYQALTTSVFALKNIQNVFTNLSNTISALEITICSILIVVSFIILALLTWLLINDLLKLVSMLKTLGYSAWSNAFSLICVLIPVWFIAVILSLPIAISLISFFNELIFSSLSILTISTLNIFGYIGMSLGLGLIFGFIFIIVGLILNKIDLTRVMCW